MQIFFGIAENIDSGCYLPRMPRNAKVPATLLSHPRVLQPSSSMILNEMLYFKENLAKVRHPNAMWLKLISVEERL
jgi:hypothetical protein